MVLIETGNREQGAGGSAQRVACSVQRTRSLRKFCFLCVLCVLCVYSLSANPSEAVSLSSEISRLQALSRDDNSYGRFQALMELARLYRLSGDSGAALGAYEDALVIFPNDGQVLLEMGRLLVSLGEYERALFAFNTLLSGNRELELLVQGLYYISLLDAFHLGNTQALEGLAEESLFSEYHSRIFYTLWLITEDRNWENRLLRDFPKSLEAGIISHEVELSAIPLWLFFPGRESITLSPRPAETVFFQTGLFNLEENALSGADLLSRAGFAPHVIRRQVNNMDYWAVGIYSNREINTVIRQLNDAGFEAFPVR